MWEQDSNLDLHVIVKTEPEDKEAEDSNHDVMAMTKLEEPLTVSVSSSLFSSDFITELL
jgi:hypothetical protein